MAHPEKFPVGAIAFLIALVGSLAIAMAKEPTSLTLSAVLRQPLPPENLKLSRTSREYLIEGPTFTYAVEKRTGAIRVVKVVRGKETVISSATPADLVLDDYQFSKDVTITRLEFEPLEKGKIVLHTEGRLPNSDHADRALDFRATHTFFNDGVMVSEFRLIPKHDLPVERGLAARLAVNGQFDSYLHKRRDEHGQEAARGRLPAAGSAVGFQTLSSCLSVYSPDAGLAVFTDGGSIHLSRSDMETASVTVGPETGGLKAIRLEQHLVRVAAGDKPFVLKAGEEFVFRTGISLAPNRLPHPRSRDLRMFTWIGDTNYPYPADQEIAQVAQMGYTLFQMHRVGTVGEPRPPAGELERVIRKVHETGMLFLWEENADLLYDSAPGVQQLKAAGKWKQWQGFNYGGRYTATMDPYCDLVATCLASPNGLAEYRLANINRMLDRFPVDGIYLDDNLAYENCTLQKEHGHPRAVYDCLIELHEMNWRRRELLRQRCPHTVLISHCTKAFVLPVICDFDIELYGEGYSFGSPEEYWDQYVAPISSFPAQGMIWPGGQDPVRCASAAAYKYDLLTGGGQYCQIDWRLFRGKFPHAAGVSPLEPLYAKTYNLAQQFFGFYESTPFYFAAPGRWFNTSAKGTYASIYRNDTWKEWLIAVANMGSKETSTTLSIRDFAALGLNQRAAYSWFDIHERTAHRIDQAGLIAKLADLSVPTEHLRLICLREQPTERPFHLWGGKRISESWNARRQKLALMISGPPGLATPVFIMSTGQGISAVHVDGRPAAFQLDPNRHLVWGEVTFGVAPLEVEVTCAGTEGALPERTIPTDPLLEAIRR